MTGSGPGSSWAGFQPIGQNFTFNSDYSLEQQEIVLERHRLAYGKIRGCTAVSSDNQAELLTKYEDDIKHDVDTRDAVIASAYLNGDEIFINLNIFFGLGRNDQSQTLLHEFMHLIGESHPDRIFPPDNDADVPFDNGPYYGSPPLRAELCIAGTQSDEVACRETGGKCSVSL